MVYEFKMNSPKKHLRSVNNSLMRKRSDNTAYISSSLTSSTVSSQQQNMLDASTKSFSSCDSPTAKQRHHSVATPPQYRHQHSNYSGGGSASSSPLKTASSSLTGTPPPALVPGGGNNHLRHARFRRSFRSSMKKFNFSKVFDGFRQSMAQSGSPPASAGRHTSGGGSAGAQSGGMASTPAERKEGQQCDERLPQIDALIQPELFAWGEIMRRGFPFQPTCIDYDPLQNLIAIGTKSGHVRIMGRPGVDRAIKHEDRAAVVHVHFIKNEGALLTVCPDDTLHLWSFRQQAKLERLHKLKFQKESISVVSAPFQSKFVFVGTDKGNVYTVGIDTFQLTPYQIAWNKAIGLQEIAHPGACIILSDCPNDANMLLIGFDSGLIILWDLKARVNRAKFNSSVSPNVAAGQFPPGEQQQQHVQQQQLLGLTSLKWHWDDRMRFVSSHLDGSLAMWSCKQPQAPVSVHYPHGKHSPLATALNTSKDAETKSKTIEFPTPIGRVDWRAYSRASNASPRPGSVQYDGLMIFSGGIQMPATASIAEQNAAKNDADATLAKRSRFDITTITLQHGASVNVLEMDHGIIDFLTIMPTPWPNSSDDPIALLVLLKGDLVAIDLKTPGFPAIANPYPMSIHESPVTSCIYLADCRAEVIQQLFVAGKKQQQQQSSSTTSETAPSDVAEAAALLSQKPWPISGGNWGSSAHSRLELVLTGHHDGSIKVWDASTQMLQLLLKIKTRSLFEKPPHFTVMSVAASSAASSSTGGAAQQRQQQWYNSMSSADSCASSMAGNNISGVGANNLNVPAGGARRMRSPSPSHQYTRNGSPNVRSGGAAGVAVDARLIDGLFAVKMMAISKDATLMAAAGNAGQIYVYELAKQEDQISDLQCITIPVIIGYSDDDSNDDIEANAEPPVAATLRGGRQWSKDQLLPATGTQQNADDSENAGDGAVVDKLESLTITTTKSKIAPGKGAADVTVVEDFGKLMLKPQSGVVRRPAGYRLNCIVMPQLSTDHKRSIRNEIWAHYSAHFASNHCLSVFPPPITSLAVSSHFGTVAFGTDCGFAIVDTIQHYCLISLPTSELYGPTGDPWLRMPYQPLEPLTCICIRKDVGSMTVPIKRRESPKTSSTTSTSSVTAGASIDNAYADKPTMLSAAADPFAGGEGEFDNDAVQQNDNIELDVESATTVGDEPDEGIGSRAESQNTTASSSSTNTLLSETTSSSKSGSAGKPAAFSKAEDNGMVTSDVSSGVAPKTTSSIERASQQRGATSTASSKLSSRSGWLSGNGRVGSNDAAQEKLPPNALANEAITALLFADSLVKKNDAETCSALWLGTSTGFVTVVDLNLPRNRADRLSQTSFPAPCSSTLLRIPPLAPSAVHSKNSNASSPTTSPTHSSKSAAATEATADSAAAVAALAVQHQHQLQALIYSDALLQSNQRVLQLALLDQNGCLCDESSFHYNNADSAVGGSGTPVPVAAEQPHHDKLGAKLSGGGDNAPSSSSQRRCRQYLVMVGPQQARVVALPTHAELYNCVFEKALAVDNADSALALRAHVTNVPTAERVTTSWPPALVLQLRSQRVAIFSLPSLRLVQCTELVQPGRLAAMSATAVRRLNHTLSFGGHAHLLYMPSPSELVFGSVSSHVTQQTEAIAPQLFSPAVVVPEPPKPSFMKGLFGLVGSQSLTQSIDEREELLGQIAVSGAESSTSSTKGAANVARYSGSTQQANTKEARTQAQGAGSEISRAKMMALERGEKLGELEDRTERMRNEADSYASNAQKLMEKYRDKKWYNPF